ncbi:MAG TPA: heme o synthase [Steroidobacteraceae bacterium]|nr:heme o synthase [Steroidobacteraceae bacterium]HRX89613.1 heme o synthase [Steroidobacteraceae bacterium]
MTTIPVQAASSTLTPRWRVVLGVFKLRIGVLIMLTALAGLAISPAAAPSGWKIVVMALAVLVASASAGAFNQFIEADSDRMMARTRERAFASGALQPGPVWLGLILALLAAAVAVAWLVLNGAAAIYLFLGAFTYGVIYTIGLKRRTWLNIVFGGLAGSFAVLTGAAAADPTIGVLPLLLAVVLFLWTPPHFWSLAIANRDEYAGAGIPMLPVVVGTPRAAQIVHANTILLVIASLLPAFFGMGPAYVVAAMSGGAWFLFRTHKLARDPNRRTALAAFFASMLQLAVLIGGVTIDALLR